MLSEGRRGVDNNFSLNAGKVSFISVLLSGGFAIFHIKFNGSITYQ